MWLPLCPLQKSPAIEEGLYLPLCSWEEHSLLFPSLYEVVFLRVELCSLWVEECFLRTDAKMTGSHM